MCKPPLVQVCLSNRIPGLTERTHSCPHTSNTQQAGSHTPHNLAHCILHSDLKYLRKARTFRQANHTHVQSCQHPSSCPQVAAALCSVWSTCLPDPLWYLAKLARPSQQPQLDAGRLCPDTTALGQSRSRHDRPAQHLPALIRPRCSSICMIVAAVCQVVTAKNTALCTQRFKIWYLS